MRLGFDIGGTFTDIVSFADDGRILSEKVLSLHDRIGQDVVECMRRQDSVGRAEIFVHATTVGSNAVIEGTAAPTALITTDGFRDILELRDQRRPNIYDPNWERVPALVPRQARLEVTERILSTGIVETSLDLDQARAVVRNLIDQNYGAIAVCLINAYINPVHERAVRDLIHDMAPHIVVCLSSDIDPQIKEYERCSTTVVNASLVPVIDSYLAKLEHDIGSVCERLLIMQSNGGVMSSQAARQKPISMIESGPAAGALAAARLARECGLDNVLAFDMGGTTVKGCLIENGQPLEKPVMEIGGANVSGHGVTGAGHAVRVPSLDIVEAGAGGGSIAWIDKGGALRVGPRSAGAEPGPVCYGRGGTDPTVTDANVVLGYINPGAIAGAKLRIDRASAERAISEKLSGPLGMDVRRVASGIRRVANSTMTRVLKAVTTERGRDPRECALMAFGGSGPVHAASLAETMGITTVVIPIYPGLFSALGLLLADYRQDHVSSVARRVDAVSLADLDTRIAGMRADAIADMAAHGIGQDQLRFEILLDLKYGFQMDEMTLACPQGLTEQNLAPSLSSLFNTAHQKAYGYARGEAVELAAVKLRAWAAASRDRFADLAAKLGDNRPVSAPQTRKAWFEETGGEIDVAVLARFDIPETPMAGPVVIDEPDTTIVVPPGWSVHRDGLASLILTRNLSAP